MFCPSSQFEGSTESRPTGFFNPPHRCTIYAIGLLGRICLPAGMRTVFAMPEKKKQRPKQEQPQQPGREHKMQPRPKAEDGKHRGSGKLQNKVALITGGDSGIGRAIAIAFAKEGANISIVYLEEHKDAKETQRLVEEHGRRCLLIPGDVGNEKFCRNAVDETVDRLGKLNILVNNAAEQHPQDSIEKISEKQLERTFRTNVFAYFFLVKAA